MSFSAKVFRVMIASPSDVSEERDVAVQTIQEWNNLNSPERQVVLLPVRWESHAAPEYGRRPQEIINRQVVDYCDILVGIFWSRIGSPTGEADSGTVEEIERIASAGKVVMLYFSQAKQDLDKIDTDQLTKLRAFKEKTLPGALVENYSGIVEFKEKLSRQLEIQLRSILASEQDDGEKDHIRPITDIDISFADAISGAICGPEISLTTTYITIEDFDIIPDFEDENSPEKLSSSHSEHKSKEKPISTLGQLFSTAGLRRKNRDFYRQLITHQVIKEFYVPVRFVLTNKGGIGARDVYIEISLSSENASFFLIRKDQIPSSLPRKEDSKSVLLGSQFHAVRPEDAIKSYSDSWSTTLEVHALQPQRIVSPDYAFLIGAESSCKINVTAKIYADTLARPETRNLQIDLDVNQKILRVKELLEDKDFYNFRIE